MAGSHINHRAVNRGLQVLSRYRIDTDTQPDEPADVVLIDLLTDIMAAWRQRDTKRNLLPFDDCVRIARMHDEAESEGA